MKNILLITCAFLSLFQLNFAKLPTLPDGYPFNEGNEAVYKYVLNASVSVVVSQLGARYRYDVITKPGPASNQLYVAVENIDYSDTLNEPSPADIAALKIPFLVYLEDAGEWEKVKMSSKETAFSMDQKENILDILTFDKDEVEKVVGGVVAEIAEEFKNDLPLGESCNVQVDKTNDGEEITFSIKANRNQCTGNSQLQLDGNEISADSTVKVKYDFDKNPLRFKKAELKISAAVGKSPKIVMNMEHTLEFDKFRPFQTNFEVENLTEIYNESEFLVKLEQLKAASESDD